MSSVVWSDVEGLRFQASPALVSTCCVGPGSGSLMFPIESSQVLAGSPLFLSDTSPLVSPQDSQVPVRAALRGLQGHLSAPSSTEGPRKRGSSSEAESDSESAGSEGSETTETTESSSSSDSSGEAKRAPAFWDEQVSDAELWIAAGAAPEGAGDETIYRIYERYVSALKNLSWRIDPSLRDLVVTGYEVGPAKPLQPA